MTAICCKKCLYEGNPADAHYCASCGANLDSLHWQLITTHELSHLNEKIKRLNSENYSLREQLIDRDRTITTLRAENKKLSFSPTRYQRFKRRLARMNRWFDDHETIRIIVGMMSIGIIWLLCAVLCLMCSLNFEFILSFTIVLGSVIAWAIAAYLDSIPWNYGDDW